MEIDIKNMSYDELENMAAEIARERARRREKERLDDWRKVSDAIDNYCQKYGNITVECDIISDGDWLCNPGVIG